MRQINGPDPLVLRVYRQEELYYPYNTSFRQSNKGTLHLQPISSG